MKDITHYFADLHRNSESATVPTKEVREERANIEETVIVEEESRPKRKRGRVKIKISRKSNEGPVCDIVDSSTDLVDKTPSPFPQLKRRHIETDDDTPKKKSSMQDSSAEAPSARLNKKIKKSMDEEIKNQANGVETPTKACDDVLSAEQTAVVAVDDKTDEEKTGENSVKRKRGRPRKDFKEKLIELAEKKGYAERKALEAKEAEKMERIFEKRKKYFTVQPKNNNAEVTQSDENSPKNSEPGSVKRPGSLLNYFSKATPEHLEKERLMKAKLTVKADVHTPTNSPIFVTPASDKKKKDSPKKKKSSAKQLEPEFDEIQLIQTETIVLSPKNEKLKSPVSQNKPRWSMKIQLQSNSVSTSGMKDDEEIYTPTAPSKIQRENMKNNDKIPKVLLPMKNKKSDQASLDGHNKSSNEKKSDKSEKKDSMIDKEEKSNEKEKKGLMNDKEEKSRKSDKKNSINDIVERSNKVERKNSINNKEEKSNRRERKNSINKKEDKSNKIEGKNSTNNKEEKSNKRERKNSINDKEEKSNKMERKNSTSNKEEKSNRRERKNSSNSKEDNVKTDKQKTEINEKLNNFSTAEESKTYNDSVELVEVIEVIEDEAQAAEENSLKRKSKEKLAPLFTKRIKPSAEVIAARRLFLQSDINENTDGNAKKKTPPLGPKMLPFPKISHVNQLQPEEKNSVLEPKFSLKNNGISHSLFDFSLVKDKSVLDRSIPVSEHLFECVKTNIETVLAEVESYCSDVHSLWKYVSTFSKPENPKPVPRTRRRTSEKKDLRKSSDTLDELRCSPWTDKYKPNTTTEVVGNEEAAIKLKAWLDGWKAGRNNEDYSSGEEFYNSDCSLSSNIENNHVAILIGPHGSGKTASVYAVAHELGYKVLEVNASSKRPGKKILKDFEEATKSHRVKKSTLKDAFVTIPKKEEETKKISQNSLILFEDVDLIFEEDEGFVSAAFQLASNTKRPIVMTLRDTCSYLPKLAPQQFRINFQPVSGKRVPALLQLIALAETGCKLSQNCVDALCQSGDLRKGLLQLQYLLTSGKDRISSTSLAVNKSIWKEIRANLYKPAIKAEKSRKKKQTSDDKNVPDKALDNLVTNLDRFSIISTLIDIEDPTSELLDIKSEPSMSLSENMNSYSSLENTSLEIGNWLKNAVMKSAINDSKKSNSQIDSSNHLLTKKQINRDVDLALSQIASNTSDRRALSVDYLSSIRTICRAEEIRNQLNSKRGNRFFHYLQNSRIASGAARSGNILSAACTMLHEKSTTAET